MQLACGLDFPQSQSKQEKHNQDACVRKTRGGGQSHYTRLQGHCGITGELQSGSQTRVHTKTTGA